INPYVFQKYHGIDKFTEKTIGLIIIVLIIRFVFRLIDAIIAINDDNTSHTTVGVRTFGQMIKILVTIIGIQTVITTLIDVNIEEIITVLGALTAEELLTSTDNSLRYESSLQIASSRSTKDRD